MPGALIFSRVMLASQFGAWKIWNARIHGNVRFGRFELHGLDAETVVPVFFLDPEHKVGATLHVSGKSAAGGEVTVRLEPCGSARGRFVDPRGQLVKGPFPPGILSMVVTPGPSFRPGGQASGLLFADEGRLGMVDNLNYAKPLVPGPDGWTTFPVLIPGATYRIIDRTPFRGLDGPQLRKEFIARAGETIDLGDIVIEKPK